MNRSDMKILGILLASVVSMPAVAEDSVCLTQSQYDQVIKKVKMESDFMGMTMNSINSLEIISAVRSALVSGDIEKTINTIDAIANSQIKMVSMGSTQVGDESYNERFQQLLENITESRNLYPTEESKAFESELMGIKTHNKTN